jgi:exonuclease SbcD
VGTTIVPRLTADPTDLLVEVPSRDGSHAALIACVPFVPERWFGRGETLFASTEGWYQSYAENMGAVLEGVAKVGFRIDRVNVLMAHFFANGSKIGGGEREATIGLEYAVSPARFPGDAAYIALGHIHRPQVVAGSPAPARYSGSLLQLDFGEVGHGKSVAIVEALPGKPARVEPIPLTAGRRLMDIRGSLDEVTSRTGSVGDAWLRVFVTVDGPRAGVADEVREALPNAIAVHLVYEPAEGAEPVAPIGSLSPREQFLRYYRTRHGAEPEETLLAAFDEVLTAEEAGVGVGGDGND